MSFFSFQDIITCVTGIMLLLALTIVLELLARKPSDTIVPPQQNEIAAQEKKLQELQRATQKNRVTLTAASSQLQISQNTFDVLTRQLNELKKTIEQALFAEEDRTTADKEKLRQIEELKKKNQTLLLELEELVKPKGTKTAILVTLRQRQSDGKIPYWVELGENEITVNRISLISQNTGIVDSAATFSGSDCVRKFLEWARISGKCSPLINKFVLLVRPGAAERWAAVSASLKQMGYVTGCDTWSGERHLIQTAGVK